MVAAISLAADTKPKNVQNVEDMSKMSSDAHAPLFWLKP